MPSTEAEAVKLFSNTYLALRVAYFNEMDTYCEIKGLNVSHVLEGVGLDKRIGCYYNNPSFGFGGYCLPKDTKQLLAEYGSIPQNIIKAIVESNNTRKKHITEIITKGKTGIIGIYKLTMKKNSDNYRYSAILDIIELLKEKNKRIVIYEPSLESDIFNDCDVINDLDEFAKTSDIIVANRIEKELEKYKNKVYTRDIYNVN